jgi:pSer/pThr/pTyr-binding forkhead associated (FHA) protein
MLKLVITAPDKKTQEYSVEREMTLGRNPGNDIQINEEKASRRHCRFRPEDGKLTVEDLGSSNGTKVNGVKIEAVCTLKDGDTIAIGAHTIVFRDGAQKSEEPHVKSLDADDLHAAAVLPDVPPEREEEHEGRIGAVFAAVAEPDELALVPRADKDKPEKKSSARLKTAGQRPVAASAPPPSRSSPSAGRIEPAKTGSPVGAVVMTIAAALLVGVGIVWWQQSSAPGGASASAPTAKGSQPAPPTKQAAPEQPDPPKKAVGPTPVRPAQPVVPPKVTRPPPAIEDPNVAADFTKALTERDRAIETGNFPGARAAISSFLAAHPEGKYAARAQQELAETKRVVDAALSLLWQDTQTAAAAKQYRLATQRCTRLAAADPQGQFGTQARELLLKIDESTAPRFTEVRKTVDGLLEAGQLDKAGETLEKTLDELGGTKWAEQIAASHLQVLMARAILRQLDAAIKKETAPAKKARVSCAAAKVTGALLTGVTGLSLQGLAGLRPVTLPVKDLTAAELDAVLQPLGLAKNHLELAYLWLLLGKTAVAQAEVEKALLDPEQAAAAARLVNLLPNQRNLRVYDFSKWQHQSDWEALSGSWSTQNDRYVLDSAEGGDTMLKTAALGGPFAARNARVSFDFELGNPAPGYFFAFELGAEDQRTLSVLFSEKGAAVHANLNGPVSGRGDWTAGPTHVDIAVTGDSVSLHVNGRKTPPLEVPGLAALKGTVTFRVREAACAIDNVIVRNAE